MTARAKERKRTVNYYFFFFFCSSLALFTQSAREIESGEAARARRKMDGNNSRGRLCTFNDGISSLLQFETITTGSLLNYHGVTSVAYLFD